MRRWNSARILGGLAVALALFSGHASAAESASTPTSPIEGLYRTLIGIMQHAKELGVKGRYDKLAPVLSTSYDVASMAQASVGRGWETMQPKQQQDIIAAFTRMMVATYASRFDDYSGEHFEITQMLDQAPADKMVKTQVVPANGKPVALNYVVRNQQGTWRIVDVYLDGTISELASRRAEFGAILKSGGADALVASLRQQGDKLLAGS
jgi:phospholipid transport system substrate-binding protein